jgi:hypothetical protein
MGGSTEKDGMAVETEQAWLSSLDTIRSFGGTSHQGCDQ